MKFLKIKVSNINILGQYFDSNVTLLHATTLLYPEGVGSVHK